MLTLYGIVALGLAADALILTAIVRNLHTGRAYPKTAYAGLVLALLFAGALLALTLGWRPTR